MKKYELYFFGSDYSFVSAFFLYSLISFTKRNKKFKIKHIVNTDTFFSFDQDSLIYKFKNKIKFLIYFFFNKKYYSLEKNINEEFNIKKSIKKQASLNKIPFSHFDNFKKNNSRDNSILLNVGGIKIFPKKFLDRFKICINYHNAELPRFRGANSNSMSLMYNKIFTYFSFHYVNAKIDRGYVFYKNKIKIFKKIKHHLFYENLKIKSASNNIHKILTKALSNEKSKSLPLKRGGYYPMDYHKKFFLNINQFPYKEIQKHIDIFGGIYYMNNFITGIKKSSTGISLKDCKIKITEIKYFPVIIYKFLIFLSVIKS